MSATEEEQQQQQQRQHQQKQQHRHRASWTLPCHFHTLSLMNCKSRAEAFAKSLHNKLKSLGRLAGDDDQDEEDDEGRDLEERGLKEAAEIESEDPVRNKNTACIHTEKTRLISAPHHGSPTGAVDGFLSQHGEDELYFDFDISSPESPAEQELDLAVNRARNGAALLVTRQPTSSAKSELEYQQRSNSKLERCHAPRHFRSPEVESGRALDLNLNSNHSNVGHFENSDNMLDCYHGGAVNGVMLDEESGCISAVSSVLTEQDNDDEEDEEPFGSLNDFEDAQDGASYLWSPPPGCYGYPTINDNGLGPPPVMTSPVSSPSPCKLSTIVEQATLEESAEELWLWSGDATWRCCGADDSDDLGQGHRRISEAGPPVRTRAAGDRMLKDAELVDESDAENAHRAGLDSSEEQPVIEGCFNEMPSVEEPTSRRVRHGEATGQRNNRENHDDIQPQGNDDDDRRRNESGLNEGQVCPAVTTPTSCSSPDSVDPRELPDFGCGARERPIGSRAGAAGETTVVPLFNLGEICEAGDRLQSGEIAPPPNLLENDRDMCANVGSECQECARLQLQLSKFQYGIEMSGERSVLDSDVHVFEKEIVENMDSDLVAEIVESLQSSQSQNGIEKSGERSVVLESDVTFAKEIGENMDSGERSVFASDVSAEEIGENMNSDAAAASNEIVEPLQSSLESQNGIEKSGERSVVVNSDVHVSAEEIGENVDSDASISNEIVENERVVDDDTEENVVITVRERRRKTGQIGIPNQLPDIETGQLGISEWITDVESTTELSRVCASPTTPTSLNLDAEATSPWQQRLLTVDVTLSPATSGHEEEALSPCNPDEDEAPQRVRRSSSLKTGKTPPGTPNRKKIVRFADAFGLDLEDVKHVFLDDLPTVPSSAYVDLRDADQDDDDQDLNTHLQSMTVYNSHLQQDFPNNFGPSRPASNLVPVFPQPASLSDFIERLRRQSVCLESAVLAGDSSVRLVVRVLNLDFYKRVIVRYTLDEWINTRFVDAEYVQGSHDGFSDKFATVLNAEEVRVGDRLAFAVQYLTVGKEFWDNNYGQNYCFQCFAEQQYQQSPTDDSWVHFL